MTPHVASPGDVCQTCQSLAWGGERYITGKLGIHCQECWDRDWDRESKVTTISDESACVLAAKALYDAMSASADHAFMGEFSCDETTTVDGRFDLALAADAMLGKLSSLGLVVWPPIAPDKTGQRGGSNE